MNVADSQIGQLGDPHPGGVEELEQGPIPQFDRLHTLQRIEQIANNPLRERMRKCLRSPGPSHLICRIEENLAAPS
jgi:hypothetical protein